MNLKTSGSLEIVMATGDISDIHFKGNHMAFRDSIAVQAKIRPGVIMFVNIMGNDSWHKTYHHVHLAVQLCDLALLNPSRD